MVVRGAVRMEVLPLRTVLLGPRLIARPKELPLREGRDVIRAVPLVPLLNDRRARVFLVTLLRGVDVIRLAADRATVRWRVVEGLRWTRPTDRVAFVRRTLRCVLALRRGPASTSSTKKHPAKMARTAANLVLRALSIMNPPTREPDSCHKHTRCR